MINIKYRLLSAVVFTACLASCSQQDIPMPQPEGPQAIAITVTDGGYISDSPSRASENGYFTDFTNGDACGLYFVQDGEIIVSNLKVVATGLGSWNSADGKNIYLDSLDGVKAFIYYPYQEDMTGKVTASATDDAGFFAPLISTWQPKVDQSDYATGYTASDLMTAAGRFLERGDIVFPMTHRMALAVIDLPSVVYKFTDNTIPDYVTPVATEFTEDAIPCLLAGGYRYLVNPAAAEQPTVTATYNERDRIFTVSTSGLTASTSKTFVIDGGSTTGQQVDYDLQVGDFFCSPPDASGWYVIPKDLYPTATDNCIGLVFKAGKDTSDHSDYTKPLNEGGPVIGGTFHGYVMALTNVDNPRDVHMNWVLNSGNVSPGRVGTSTSSEDWNGYDNCRIIHDKVAENSGAGWSMTNFPAALACGTYGNRTVDYRGNPTDAYAWQAPFVAPANTSGWFLPSIAQLKYLYDNRNVLISKIATAREKAPSTVAGHIGWFDTSDRYFSSSEGITNTGAAWNINFRDGNCREDLKNRGGFVRAVLAF